MNGPSPSRVRVAGLLLLVFAAGAAAGVAGERLWLAPAAAGESAAEKEGRRETVIERFADDIGLTPDQRARIDRILERSHRRFRDLWKGVQPRYEALVDSVRAEVEAELTPEQVDKYRALLREQEEKEKRKKEESARKDTAEKDTIGDEKPAGESTGGER